MADAICHNCRYFKAKAGGYGDCLIHDTTVHSGGSGLYCSCFKFKDDFNKDVKDRLNLKVVSVSNIKDAKDLPYGTLVLKGRNTYLVGKNKELIPVISEDNLEEREDTSMAKDFLEEHFVKGANECDSPEDILNWYRNLYYKENDNSERRIIAEAINDFFVRKLPQLIKETRLTTISSVQSRIELAIENSQFGLCLYEDTLLPTILEYRNEVKNDKV